MSAHLVHVDDAGMLARPISDDAVGTEAYEIDGEGDAALEAGHGCVREGVDGVERGRLGIGQAAVALAEADLGEARALADDDRERAGADLGIERTHVARSHGIEGRRTVGEHAGEHVETARRALGVGDAAHGRGQGDTLLQLRHVDAPRLENGAVREIDLEEAMARDALLDGRAGARQEARPHAPRPGAQAQVHAGRLDLAVEEWSARRQQAGRGHQPDRAVGLRAGCEGGRGREVSVERYVAHHRSVCSFLRLVTQCVHRVKDDRRGGGRTEVTLGEGWDLHARPHGAKDLPTKE